MRAPRIFKQTFFLVFYVAVISFTIYQLVMFIVTRPTCTDRIMNQNESGVDCGGKCRPCEKVYTTKDLQVEEKYFVAAGIGKYDVMAKIKNPNSNVGSSSFDYQFILKDKSGETLVTQNGTGFILPSEEKYILKIGISTNGSPSELEIKMDNIKWEEFTGYEEPDLVISNIDPSQISSGVGYYEVKGLLKNESAFDFTVINMKIILRDADGRIVAINESEMKTINSGEERDFRQVWPNHFAGNVSSVEVDPEANVYKNETFLKHYLPSKDTYQYQYKTQR